MFCCLASPRLRLHSRPWRLWDEAERPSAVGYNSSLINLGWYVAEMDFGFREGRLRGLGPVGLCAGAWGMAMWVLSHLSSPML